MIGGGVAALRAAIAAREAGADVLVCCKGIAGRSGNTVPSTNNGPGNDGNLWDIRNFDITAFLTAGQRPDQANIDPSTFGPQTLPPEQGLYVWVRQGAVTLAQGGQVVELKQGSAARVGDKIVMLGSVPNFMRFDFTPRPGGAIPPQVPRMFRAPDGSITGMCK